MLSQITQEYYQSIKEYYQYQRLDSFAASLFVNMKKGKNTKEYCLISTPDEKELGDNNGWWQCAQNISHDTILQKEHF